MVLKGQNKIVAKQGEQLKKFKESNGFFDGVGLSQSDVYFKLRPFKFLPKYSMLKNSALPSSHLRINFKLIKRCVIKAKVYLAKHRILKPIRLSPLSMLLEII